jgi:antitoxin (DNA-binding transcriptional repressor) of toxin-antitoxin stability system
MPEREIRTGKKTAMPTTQVDVRELAGRFAEILAAARAGTEVIVTEGDVPRAKLVPLSLPFPRTPGLHPGSMHAAEDFDAPLSDEFWLGTS